MPAGSYLPAANGPRPELYPNYTSISFPDRLIARCRRAQVDHRTILQRGHPAVRAAARAPAVRRPA